MPHCQAGGPRMTDRNDWYAARTVSSFKKPLPESIHHTERQNEAEEKTQNHHKMTHIMLSRKDRKNQCEEPHNNTHTVPLKGETRPSSSTRSITSTHIDQHVVVYISFLQNQSTPQFLELCNLFISYFWFRVSAKAARFPNPQGVRRAKGSSASQHKTMKHFMVATFPTRWDLYAFGGQDREKGKCVLQRHGVQNKQGIKKINH